MNIFFVDEVHSETFLGEVCLKGYFIFKIIKILEYYSHKLFVVMLVVVISVLAEKGMQKDREISIQV
jgi:hypothetical protein